MRYYYIAVCFALLIVGCGSVSSLYTITQMGAMSKGDAPELVAAKIDKSPEFMVDTGDGVVHIYKRHLREGPSGEVFTFDLYYFENKALVYWGSPDDFKIHEFERIREAAIISLEKIMEES